jgi:hypothetical protein
MRTTSIIWDFYKTPLISTTLVVYYVCKQSLCIKCDSISVVSSCNKVILIQLTSLIDTAFKQELV